jgi:DNA-binding transcriptional ArsR family regulator
MDEVATIAYSILFCITSIFLLVYLKRLRSASREYAKSRRILEDIIFSFNSDLKKIEEKVNEITKITANYEGKIAEKIQEKENMDSFLADIKSKLEELVGYKERISTEIEDLRKKIEEISSKYSELLKRINEYEKSTTAMMKTQGENRAVGSHPYLITERGDKVISSLTATELKVLEILAREGEKTASEIRERIGLTREHTARLMKSLYEKGYVERRDDKMPFVYRLNREMEEILKKR